MPLDAQKLDQIGEAIDRLISVDLSARGFIPLLYDEARKVNDDRPLCLTAARGLADAARPQQPIIIATGLPIRGWFSPAMAESDGPIGAATLARALYLACKALPVVICEAEQTYVAEACLRAAGLTPTTFDEYESARRSAWAVPGRELPVAIVSGFPAEPAAVKEATEQLLAKGPTGLVSIERQGADEHGRYHYGRGEENVAAVMAKIDDLFAEAHRRGIYTVGIGDGGNELGMGNIREAIRSKLPFGDKIAPAVTVSMLLAASVSNFGCYGIEGCLAALTGKPEVLHSADQEMHVIDACMRVGAVDGATGMIEPFIDSLPAAASTGFVTLLRAIVENGLTPAAIYKLDR